MILDINSKEFEYILYTPYDEKIADHKYRLQIILEEIEEKHEADQRKKERGILLPPQAK